MALYIDWEWILQASLERESNSESMWEKRKKEMHPSAARKDLIIQLLDCASKLLPNSGKPFDGVNTKV